MTMHGSSLPVLAQNTVLRTLSASFELIDCADSVCYSGNLSPEQAAREAQSVARAMDFLEHREDLRSLPALTPQQAIDLANESHLTITAIRKAFNQIRGFN